MGTRSYAFAASGTPTRVQHSESLETGTPYLVTSVRVSKTFPHSPELRGWASGCGRIMDHPLENGTLSILVSCHPPLQSCPSCCQVSSMMQLHMWAKQSKSFAVGELTSEQLKLFGSLAL